MPMRENMLYAGQYTRSGKAEGIQLYERDTESGRLTHRHTILERDPSFLAFDPSRRLLFAVNELRGAQNEGNGTVASFAVDRDRESTRLNSSHANNSYAGFCLK